MCRNQYCESMNPLVRTEPADAPWNWCCESMNPLVRTAPADAPWNRRCEPMSPLSEQRLLTLLGVSVANL